MKKLYGNKLTIIAFLAPALLLFVGVLIAPIFLSGYYSLFDMDMYGHKTFIGFKNYVELFTNERYCFVPAIKNSLLLAFFSVIIQLPLALFLALLISNKRRKGERGFLSIYFMPVLISTVVIGQLWRIIYHGDYGILKLLCDWVNNWGLCEKFNFHIDYPAAGLLSLKKGALYAIFVPTIWQYVGYHMLLLYAGIKSVPPELREAAMIDGATEGQTNRYIVLPYIKPILRISVIFAVTGSFKSYDLLNIMAPHDSALYAPTEVPSTVLVKLLLDRGQYGLGSTIGFIMIIMCFAAALIIGLFFKDRDKGVAR